MKLSYGLLISNTIKVYYDDDGENNPRLLEEIFLEEDSCDGDNFVEVFRKKDDFFEQLENYKNERLVIRKNEPILSEIQDKSILSEVIINPYSSQEKSFDDLVKYKKEELEEFFNLKIEHGLNHNDKVCIVLLKKYGSYENKWDRVEKLYKYKKSIRNPKGNKELSEKGEEKRLFFVWQYGNSFLVWGEIQLEKEDEENFYFSFISTIPIKREELNCKRVVNFDNKIHNCLVEVGRKYHLEELDRIFDFDYKKPSGIKKAKNFNCIVLFFSTNSIYENIQR